MKDSLEKDLGAKFSSMSALDNFEPDLSDPSYDLPSRDFVLSADIYNNVDEKVGSCSTKVSDPGEASQKIVVTIKDEVFDFEYQAEVILDVTIKGEEGLSFFNANTTEPIPQIIRNSNSDIDPFKIQYLNEVLTTFISYLIKVVALIRIPHNE